MSFFCPQGTRIIGVHCDTNDAKVTQLKNQRQKYTCECKGTLRTGAGQMHCYIHYWECPIGT